MTPLIPTTPRPRTPPPAKAVALPPTTPTQSTNGAPPPPTPTIAAKPRALFAANGSDSSDDDEAEPNTEYATLRLKLETLLGHAGGLGKGKSGGKQKKGPKKGAVVVQEPEEAGKIRKRMEVVKAMYFFGEKESGESKLSLVASYFAIRAELDFLFPPRTFLFDRRGVPSSEAEG